MREVLKRPAAAVAALCAAQITFWTLAPALTHMAPPLDVVEMLVWGREGVVATYKHPNLPGLLLAAVERLAPGAVWPALGVAQLCVAAAFIAVWLLGRDLLGDARALAGVLLLTGIFHYSWPTPEVNHNLVQMPLWAWTILALWRAVQRGTLAWWLVLGTLAGLSLWAKYSSGLLLVAAALWLLADSHARRCLAGPGPWAALGAFLLVAAPQAHFIFQSDFLPFRYAMGRADVAGGALSFLAAQLANHGVFLGMAVLAGLFGAGAAQRPPDEARARLFLLIMGLGPALLATALAAIAGTGLRDMWGMPMFNLSGLLLAGLLPGRLNGRRVARLGVLAGILLTALPAAYATALLVQADSAGKPWRALWPQEAIADRLLEGYRRETGTLPQIVAGPVWEAGLVALKAPGAPSVSIDAEARKSPWAGAAHIHRHGALAVWPTGAEPAPALAALIAGRPLRQELFPWSTNPAAAPIRLTWTVIPPAPRETHTGGSAGRSAPLPVP